MRTLVTTYKEKLSGGTVNWPIMFCTPNVM